MRDDTRPRSVDAMFAVAITVVAALVYCLTLQDWYYGDGPQLVNRFVQSIEEGRIEFWMHVLYMPVAFAVESALPGYQPLPALELMSAAFGAVALGCSFLLARSFRVSRRNALLATVLMGVTPAFWFFATSIEVHALHAAAVAVCACITVYAPWRWPVFAVFLSCAAFPLVYLTHRSGLLLGPAWVLLVQVARSRATGELFSRRGLVFGVGVGLLAALVLAMLAGNWLQTGETGLGIAATMAFVEDLYRGFSWRVVAYGILLPFAFLIPAVLIGGIGRPALETWMYVALVVPILLFFLFLFGDPTEGGYFLGIAPFLVVLAGHGFDRLQQPLLAWTAAVLLIGQLAMGVTRVRFSGYEHLGPERQARAEQTRQALPNGGVVVTLDFESQTISGMFEGLREINLVRAVEAARVSHTPEQFAVELEAMPETFGSSLVFDLGYQENDVVLPEIVAYADAAFVALELRTTTRRITVDGRTFLRIEE